MKFNSTSSTFAVGSAIQITTTVPAGATTGTVSVTAPGGTGVSPVAFTVTPGSAMLHHDRSLTLKRVVARIAKGRISSTDGFTECSARVTVKIQRRGQHGWKTVRSIRTKATGRFSKAIARSGTYRAVAPRVLLDAGVDRCGRAVSRPGHLG